MTQGRDRVARLHRERLISLLRVCAGVVCAGLTLAATAVPAAATARLSWSPARLIDPGSGLGRGVSLSGVSCPSVSLCVAVDDAGDVVTSTAPTSGARWTIAHVDRGHGWQPTLDGVSCPSASLCVAVDDAGDAVTSTAPTAGKGHWQIAPVDRDHGPLDGVSCPSVSLCVAVDDAGDVLTSTDPTGGPGYWSRTHVEDPSGSDDQLDGVSCPSVTLCVAVNFQRQVLTSTNPTGGAAAWRVTPVPGGDGLPLDSISCSSPSLCVATGQDGGLAITTNPTGGERAWVTRSLDAPPLFGVSCAPGGLCVTVDSNGDAFASTAGAEHMGPGSRRPEQRAVRGLLSVGTALRRRRRQRQRRGRSLDRHQLGDTAPRGSCQALGASAGQESAGRQRAGRAVSRRWPRLYVAGRVVSEPIRHATFVRDRKMVAAHPARHAACNHFPADHESCGSAAQAQAARRTGQVHRERRPPRCRRPAFRSHPNPIRPHRSAPAPSRRSSTQTPPCSATRTIKRRAGAARGERQPPTALTRASPCPAMHTTLTRA